MHPRKKLLLILLVTNCFTAISQQLTLDSVYQWARLNYPLIKQHDLIRQTADLNLENLKRNYLPQVSINGQGTYQSEVTKISIPFPGVSIEPLSKDQYKITADVNQLVYDGGVIKSQKNIEQLNANTEEKRVEVELYKLRDRINQLYLGLLLVNEQLKQATLFKADLENGIRKTEAQVINGTAFKSSLNVIKAETLKADQRIIELNAIKENLINTLSIFIGKQLSFDVELTSPTVFTLTNTVERPELNFYEAQSKLVEQQKQLIKAKNLPKTYLFAQGGYGRPGLNMLKNQFDWFYIAGVRVNWSLSGLYTYKNNRKLVDISKRTIELQKETFLLSINSQLPQQQSEINKYEKLLLTDLQIIELRKSVKEAALAQLENGVITSNDYLREVNAEDQARLTLITHQLQLQQAKINYQTLIGK